MYLPSFFTIQSIPIHLSVWEPTLQSHNCHNSCQAVYLKEVDSRIVPEVIDKAPEQLMIGKKRFLNIQTFTSLPKVWNYKAEAVQPNLTQA